MADRASMTRVKRSILLVVAMGVVLAGWFVFGFGHSIKNGDLIYLEVSSVRSGIPASATRVTVDSSRATWISGCSEIPGARSGWTTDRVSADFVDASPKAVVLAAMSRALKRAGWRRDDESPGPHQGRIPHWTLDAKSTHLVQAWAFPVGPGTHHWYLAANWIPPGPRGEGCP